MKKARIVLSAVALFAVVGGAFAFKASKFGTGTHFSPTSSTVIGTSTIYYCPNQLNFTTSAPTPGQPTKLVFTATSVSANRTICVPAASLTTYGTTVAL